MMVRPLRKKIVLCNNTFYIKYLTLRCDVACIFRGQNGSFSIAL